jgi:hypothetical protein
MCAEMATREARRLFDDANRLWFEDGATARALDLYRAAAAADPSDPTIAFQLARVLWSLSRADEARSLLDVVAANVAHDDEWSRRLLGELAAKLSNTPPPGVFKPSELDLDVLERRGLAPEDWRDVADAARKHAMFGLAAQALGRGSASFHVIELDEDQREMERAADSERNDLAILDELRLGRRA